MTVIDKVQPKDKWEFGEDVAKCFSDMLERSIPGYTDMRMLSYKLGKNFVHPDKHILDLGAASGEALRPYIVDDIANSYMGLEVSKPMRDEMNNQFPRSDVKAIDYDLRKLDPKDFNNVSLVLSILTLMFTPIQYRPQIINAVYNILPTDGAFILVEKVLGASAQVDDLLVKSYYEMKLDHGYTLSDIERKKASLEGVQVPLTANFNVEMLKSEGFRKVECFYRNLNFAGWIAIK